jgi:hypothetical protein
MKDFLILATVVWSILFLIETYICKLDYKEILFWILLGYFLLDQIVIYLEYLEKKKNK